MLKGNTKSFFLLYHIQFQQEKKHISVALIQICDSPRAIFGSDHSHDKMLSVPLKELIIKIAYMQGLQNHRNRG